MRIENVERIPAEIDGCVQRASRLVGAAGASLRGLDWKLKERITNDGPARKERYSVLAALVVECISKGGVHPRERREARDLIFASGAGGEAIDLLKQNDVGVCAFHRIGHSLQVVNTARVLASVDVVDQRDHRCIGCRAGCRDRRAGADDGWQEKD